MAALSTAALIGLGATTVAGTYNQYTQQRRGAKALEQHADYEAQLYGMNADLADAQAEDALARGHESELRSRGASRRLVGAQRASLAAQGVDIGTGSPAAVIANDAALGELDALTIRNNARREAWGYRTQASMNRNQGALTRSAGYNSARNLRDASTGTLLSGAGQLFSLYNSYGGGGGKTPKPSGKP